VLEIISLADPARISVVQHLATQAGSRTETLDPGTGRLYLMASKTDPMAAPPRVAVAQQGLPAPLRTWSLRPDMVNSSRRTG
jgi:hypothetical protein